MMGAPLRVLRCLAPLLAGALLPPPAAQAQAPGAAASSAAAPSRQEQVRSAGSQVMPFALDQTLHIFDKTADGGVQRVRVRGDAPDQVAMIRTHLRQIAAAFAARDFSAPSHIHGAGMPGLAELRAAPAGELDVTYRELDDGAQVAYVGRSASIVAAIHRWFDAQLSDHGRDAATSGPDAEP